MPRSLWMFFAMLAVVLAWISLSGRDPLNTRLPLSEDLSPVQDRLARLSDEDRELVLAYVARSRGDYMPVTLAASDYPYTAQTFAEAIALQRRFLVEADELDQRLAGIRQAEEAAYAPLRKLASVSLVRAGALPVSQINVLKAEPLLAWEQLPARAAATQTVVRHGDREQEGAVAVFRLDNRSGQPIESLAGTVEVRHTDPARDGLLPLTSCSFSRTAIPAFATVEVMCSHASRVDGERQLATMPRSAYRLIWKPQEIRLGDGSALIYRQPRH